MQKGDLVHIPQDTLLISWSDSLCPSDYLRLKVPIKALFLEGDIKLGSVNVYYKSNVWTVKSKDVYPIL